MIKNNESSIEEIDGAEINIIENIDIPNSYYYESLLKKYGDEDNLYLNILSSNEKRIHLKFPGNATFSELAKLISYKLDTDYKNSYIMFNAEILRYGINK